MAQLKCISCGIQKEDELNKAVCPMCGGEMIPVEEAEARVQSQEAIEEQAVAMELDKVFVPELMRAKMYELALPAIENVGALEAVEAPLRAYLRDRAQAWDLPDGIYKILWEPLRSTIECEIEFRDKANEKAIATLSSALKESKSATDNVSSGLGFSIITNSFASAAAYVGLSALDAKLSHGRAELKAAQDLQKALDSIYTHTECKKLLDAIDKTVANLTRLYEEKERFQKYADFYKDSQNDLGVSLAGTNLFQFLSELTKGVWGFLGDVHSLCYETPADFKLYYNPIWDEHRTITRRTYNKAEGFLKEIAAAGYVTVLSYTEKKTDYLLYYTTTGKYEDMVLRNKNFANNPQLRAAEDKQKEEEYLRAEAKLNEKKYYEAATAFAKLEGYKDSMQRSIQIWNERLKFRGKWDSTCFVCEDGTILSTNYSTGIGNLKKDGIDTVKQTGNSDGVSWAITFAGKLIPIHVSASYPWPPKPLCDNIAFGKTAKYGYVLVYTDGTSHFFSLKDVAHEKIVSTWTNICDVVIDYDGESIVGLRKDGTVCAAGKITACSGEYSKWQNIKKIIMHDNTLYGLTNDNRIYIAGKRAKEYLNLFVPTGDSRIYVPEDQISTISRRNDIVDITEAGGYVRALTMTGTVIGPDFKKDWYSGLRGVVALSSKSALKADGTLITEESQGSVGENVVDFDSQYILRADGTIWERADNKYPLKDEVKSWKMFSHINTINEDRIRGRQKAIEELMPLTKGLLRSSSVKEQAQAQIRYLENELAELSK